MLFRHKNYSDASNTLRKAKQLHKVEIKKLKQQIRKHKLLLKQAKLQYKITK